MRLDYRLSFTLSTSTRAFNHQAVTIQYRVARSILLLLEPRCRIVLLFRPPDSARIAKFPSPGRSSSPLRGIIDATSGTSTFGWSSIFPPSPAISLLEKQRHWMCLCVRISDSFLIARVSKGKAGLHTGSTLLINIIRLITDSHWVLRVRWFRTAI